MAKGVCVVGEVGGGSGSGYYPLDKAEKEVMVVAVVDGAVVDGAVVLPESWWW